MHMPFEQACPAAQAVVQLPQWFASLVTFTHPPPHVVVPVGHMAVHCELAQNGEAPVQAVPHLPQLAPSAVRFTQL